MKMTTIYNDKIKKLKVSHFVIFIPFLCMFIFSNTVSAESVCGKLNETSDSLLKETPVAAEYEYMITDTERKLQQIKTLMLWRRDRQVVVQTTESQPLELWELTRNNQLRVTRFFEREQRGIEYQPSEVKIGQEKNDWSFKYQLISDALISRMSVVSAGHENKKEYSRCGNVEYLFLNEKNKEIQLSWIPEIRLMKSLLVKELHVSTQWQLQQAIFDEKIIDQYFSQLMSYQTTDYADIGDNESDPFLIKMINLGFVEHGASGFYDSNGNSLSSQEDGHGHSGH